MIPEINLQLRTFVFRSLLFSVFSLAILSQYIEAQIAGEAVEKVKEGEFPFIVSIGNYRYSLNPEKDHDCGGSLISPRLVLTVAHCIENEMFKDSTIVLVGSTNLRSEKMKKYHVKNWVLYYKWAEIRKIKYAGEDTDVAIIQLKKRVIGINPVRISSLSKTELEGSSVTLAGWGYTNGGIEPTTLRKATMEVLTKKDCMTRVKILEPILAPDVSDDSYICYFSPPGKGAIALARRGDSGSPVLDSNKNIVAIHKAKIPRSETNQQVHIGINASRFNVFINEYIDLWG